MARVGDLDPVDRRAEPDSLLEPARRRPGTGASLVGSGPLGRVQIQASVLREDVVLERFELMRGLDPRCSVIVRRSAW